MFTADESFWCDNCNYKSGWYFWKRKKKHIAFCICFHFIHNCSCCYAKFIILFHQIAVLSVEHLCFLGLFLYFIYFYGICGQQPQHHLHTPEGLKEKHPDLSFTLTAGHLVGHLTHSWLTLLNGLLIKDYFCSILLFSRSGINLQAHIDVYTDLWQNLRWSVFFYSRQVLFKYFSTDAHTAAIKRKEKNTVFLHNKWD